MYQCEIRELEKHTLILLDLRKPEVPDLFEFILENVIDFAESNIFVRRPLKFCNFGN